MSVELETAAVDGIVQGDLSDMATLLCYHGGPAFNMLAMLITGGHLKLELKSPTKTQFRHLQIGSFIAKRTLQINSAGDVEKASLEAAISEAKQKFDIEDSTAWRSWREWKKLTSGPYPHHVEEDFFP